MFCIAFEPCLKLLPFIQIIEYVIKNEVEEEEHKKKLACFAVFNNYKFGFSLFFFIISPQEFL